MTRRTSRRRNAGGCLVIAILLTFGMVLAAVLIRWSTGEIKEYRFSLPYEEYVTKYCEEYGVDSLFIYAMMKQESSFEPDAVSVDNARGLLQLTEETYDWVKWRMGESGGSFDDMFDPETNIRYGVWLTAYLFDRFENEKTVLAAYHAGMNITAEWLKNPEYSENGKTLTVIPYDDTRYHVKKVMGYYKEYKELYGSEE